MKLIYLPVEMYQERWTEFVSGPNGMFERQISKFGIPLTVVRPDTDVRTIKTGQVLDVIGRSAWSFAQIVCLMHYMNTGDLHDSDVIYFEDFWTGGMEMLMYAMDMYDVHPKIYAFNHAQSVDPHDFTYVMRGWMRGFERAWFDCLSGVFCADMSLISLMQEGWHLHPADVEVKCHATGTVFDHSVLFERQWPPTIKRNSVVFSSRWDSEKNPGFFCDLAKLVYQERKDINFIVCTGADKIRSNDPKLLGLLDLDVKPKNLRVLEGLPKSNYLYVLRDAKVQFNCADQDFVSYTLLEATTFGCAPLYPDYLSFPRALEFHSKNLYRKNDLADAKAKLYALMDSPVEDYSWVYEKYEHSVHRMLHVMGFDVPMPKGLFGDADVKRTA